MVPPHVRRRLGASNRRVGLVFVRRGLRHYRLVIDIEWLHLAVAAADRQQGLVDEVPLPRAAIEAVIDGWDDGGSALGVPAVWWADDGIPHVSVRATTS